MSEDEREIIWMAGFFEGEGSVRISKPTKRNWGTLLCDLVNVQPDVMEPFQRRFPGYFREVRADAPRRNFWRWRVASGTAAAFLRAIEPHLRSAIYRERAFTALAFQEQKTPRVYVVDRNEYELAQIWFYLQMRELNRRGTAQTLVVSPHGGMWTKDEAHAALELSTVLETKAMR